MSAGRFEKLGRSAAWSSTGSEERVLSVASRHDSDLVLRLLLKQTP